MRLSALGLTLLVAIPAGAFAEEGFQHGRIRYTDSGVTLQRATETAAEEAAANLPFLPGDRLWTDEGGRVELQFGDTVARVDRRSKLDYVAQEDGRVVLRLWSGTLSLRLREGDTAFEIETAGGLVEARHRGIYRVDSDTLETRLSVYEGEASLESARRRVEAESGEQTFARRGEAPESARSFDRAEADEFARWETEREEREAWAGDSRRYLPDDLEPYAGEFDRNGSWYYEADIGHVWRPYVVAGWRPYFNGHWAWTPYGWTWIARESWGWGPFHYGRWGSSAALGWYWVPGNVWGPGWVSWAVGSNHVGWCALGRGDRPVIENRPRDRAVPRGSTSPWAYVRRGDVGSRDVGRRVAVDAVEARTFRTVEATRGRPTREFRIVEGEAAAVPRNVRTKPAPGDTVPELRADPATTIPFRVIRRPSRDTSEPTRYDERNRATESTRERSPRPTAEGETPGPERTVIPILPSPREQPESARRREKSDDDKRRADPNDEVLRQMFRRFSEPPSPRGESPRSEDRTSPPPRTRGEAPTPRADSPSRPPASAPRSPAPPRPRSDEDRAVKRPPHKESKQ